MIIVISGFVALGSLKNEIKHQGERLKNVDSEISKLRDVVVELARQEERLTAMDQRMLSQGQRIDRIHTIQNILIRKRNNDHTRYQENEENSED